LGSDIADLGRRRGFIADGWPEVRGPARCPFASFALLLPFHTFAFWAPDAEVAVAWRAHTPELGELARELAACHELVALAAARAPVTEVLAELWPRLEAATPSGDFLA
jgi:hypothetical protein